MFRLYILWYSSCAAHFEGFQATVIRINIRVQPRVGFYLLGEVLELDGLGYLCILICGEGV